jgi:hypothetical protein
MQNGPTGEQRDAIHPFAARPRHHFDVGLEGIVRLVDDEIGLAALE